MAGRQRIDKSSGLLPCELMSGFGGRGRTERSEQRGGVDLGEAASVYEVGRTEGGGLFGLEGRLGLLCPGGLHCAYDFCLSVNQFPELK